MSNIDLWSFSNPFLDSKLRYQFSNKYVKGKVLDYNFSSHMAYFGSKILLDSDATEVWHHNISEKNPTCMIRKYSKDNSIDCNLIENQTFAENSFDCLVSFDTLLFIKNRVDVLKTFSSIIKNDGFAIVSIPNLRLLDYPIYKKFNHEKNYLKEEFLADLQKYFEIELYSLIFKTDSNKKPELGSKIINEPQLLLLKSLRKPIKFFASKIDKNFNFFELHMKDKYIQLDAYDKEKTSRKLEIVPSKQTTDSNSLYYIAVTKKIIKNN